MSAPCLPVVHRKKRKRNDNVSNGVAPDDGPSDGEEKEFGHDDDDDDVETFDDIETMDAAEYLSRVVHQAKKLPEVFVAPASDDTDSIPERHRNYVAIDGSAASLSYLVSARASLTRPPSAAYLPEQPSEWWEVTLANFERLRDYLEECRLKGIGGKLTDRTAFPPMKDRAGWHMFCVGSDEANGNSNAYFGDDYSEVEKSENSPIVGNNEAAEDIPEWQKDIPARGHAPSVRLLAQMDQVLVRRVLSHLTYYTRQGWELTAQQSAWIYALLARLEKPVHRDDASTLFGMLKVLTLSRSKLDMTRNRKDLARLNVLIALIGVYFEQGANTVMTVE